MALLWNYSTPSTLFLHIFEYAISSKMNNLRNHTPFTQTHVDLQVTFSELITVLLEETNFRYN
jgi:hypothetical protein